MVTWPLDLFYPYYFLAFVLISGPQSPQDLDSINMDSMGWKFPTVFNGNKRKISYLVFFF